MIILDLIRKTMMQRERGKRIKLDILKGKIKLISSSY